MDPNRYKQVSDLFKAVVELAPERRGAFLASKCAGDPELRAEVESLLAEDEAVPESLKSSVELTLDSAPTVLPECQPGDRIDRYVVREPVGEGGFAVVYLADQREPVRRQVALKIIKLGMDTKQVIRRFEAERQALALMDHPHVAKVFDAGATERGRPYFVMEYVPGSSITEYCDRHKLSTPERLELFGQACEAVQHAHQKGIIHRDIKPSNVLVTVRDGRPQVKVIDFGVAKAISHRLTEKTVYTELGQLIGTPEYMSPEQAEMGAHDIDTRTDIYSLGVLLYELLVGALPFDPTTLRRAAFAEIQRIIREEEPPRPSTRLSSLGDESGVLAEKHRSDSASLIRDLRGDLDWITMKAMDKDRTRRYGTASDLAADIGRHLRHEPVAAGPPGAAYRLKKYVRRHRVGVTAAAAFALALVGGIAGTSWMAVVAMRSQRAEADQRRIAEAVNEFLNMDLLAAVDPANTPDREITMREVLDAAAARIDVRFTHEPVVEAAIRMTLGETYLNLGKYGPAETHLNEALKIRRRELGEDHADTLDSMNSLGRLRRFQSRFDESAALLDAALEHRRRILGDEHPDTLESMRDRAALYDKQGLLAEAERLYLQTLDIQRLVLGDEHRDTLATMGELADMYDSPFDQPRYAEAEALFDETLRIQRRVLGDEHPDTLGTMQDLARLYNNIERYQDAVALYSEALEVYRRVLGEEHPDTLVNMNNLAWTYRVMGRHDLAEPLFAKAVELAPDVLGYGHPSTMAKVGNLFRTYREQSRYGEAEALCRRVFAAQRRTLPVGHESIGHCLSWLGLSLIDRKAYAEAEPVLREGLDILRRQVPDHRATARAASYLGANLAAQSRYDEAEPLLLEAYDGFTDRKLKSLDISARHDALLQLVRLYDARGQPEKAAQWRARPLEDARRQADRLGDDADRELVYEFDRAMVFLLDYPEEYVKAIEAGEEALDLCETLLASDPDHLALNNERSNLLWRLAYAAVEIGDNAAAKRYYRGRADADRRLAALEPENPFHLEKLAWDIEQVGDLLSADGDREGARAEFLETFRIREELASEDPDNLHYKFLVADALWRLGFVAETLNDHGLALDYYRRRVAVEERLQEADPESSRHGYIAWTCARLAALAERQALAEDARAWSARADEARRALMEDSRASANALNDYAWFLLVGPEELRDAEWALAIAELAVQKGKGTNPNNLDTLARACFMTGNLTRAIELQQRAIDLLPPTDTQRRAMFKARLRDFQDAARPQPAPAS